MKKFLLLASAVLILLLATAYTLPEEADTEPPALPPPPSYSAGAVVVLCADTGMVLYGHEYHTPLYPASITKVMTALVVLDHITDLSERVEFSHHAVFSIPRNSAHISMDVGETLSVSQALYALMLRSGNEVAIALAEHVAGTEEEFVDLMNHRAVSIGAENTHFTNPTGLPGVGHVTTAYDMALIMREAVRLYPIFTHIIATPQFAIPPTERQRETRYLNNTNQLIRPGPYFNPRVVGSKTGWTHAAGNTLVTYAAHDSRRLIVTILQSAGTDPFRETTALLDFAFALPYEERVVFNAATYTRTVPVFTPENGTMAEIYRLTLQAEEDFLAYLPANFDMTRLRYSLTIQENILAPVTAGDVLGNVGIYVQNARLGTVDLLAKSTVAIPAPPPDTDPAYEAATPYAPLYYYDPYTAAHYPLPTDNLLGFLRESERLAALAVPLVVIFVSLLFAVFVLAARRKRTRRHRRYGYGMQYRYRT